MTDTPAPARRLSAAERDQWWLKNRDRTDELLHSPDPIPRIGGVDDAAVRPGWYFRDEHHKRPPVERSPVVDLRRTEPVTKPKPTRAPKNGRPQKVDGVVTVDGERFGEWIRLKRIERGMSQRAVTYAVRCSHARIYQLEVEWGGPAQQITPLVRKLVRLFREES